MKSESEISIDEMFAQIAKNERAFSELIKSQEARIARLEFRINRMERERQP